MDEYTLMYQFAGGLVGLVIATVLYRLGGISGKWKRRFVASFVLALTLNVLFLLQGKWLAWYLLTWPLLVGGLSMGYGGTDDTLKKVLRRSLYALGVTAAGAFCAYFIGGGAWLMFAVHLGIGCFSVILGVRNPLPASIEEMMVCLTLNLCLLCYPFL